MKDWTFIRLEKELLLANITIGFLSTSIYKMLYRGFPGGTVDRTLPPRQGMEVQSPSQEDSTCHGAAKSGRPNYWAQDVDPTSGSYWAQMPQLLTPSWSKTRETTGVRGQGPTVKRSPHAPQVEKAPGPQEDPAKPNINKKYFLKRKAFNLNELWQNNPQF